MEAINKDLFYAGVLLENTFDLGGIDIHAGFDNQVILSSQNFEEPRAVCNRDVTGAKPSVLQNGMCFFGLPVIPKHYAVPFYVENTFFVFAAGDAPLIQNFDRDRFQRKPDTVRIDAEILGR